MDGNKKKPIIAIDIDDVLSDNAVQFINYCNKHWGRSLTIDDYDEDLHAVLGVDDAGLGELFEEYNNSDTPSNYNCIPGSNDALSRLKNDYQLLIVTSRPTDMKEQTVEWVQRNFPGIFSKDQVIFAGFWDVISGESNKCSKGGLIKELGADYIIDDQPKHCVGASEYGVIGILFGDYAWNQSGDLPKNIQRAKDWAGVLDYFYGQQKY